MFRIRPFMLQILIFPFFVSSCASSIPKIEHKQTPKEFLTLQTAPKKQRCDNAKKNKSLTKKIESLLGDFLSVDDTVLLALLNNRNFNILYEKLGVTRSDLVQFGLLNHPVFLKKEKHIEEEFHENLKYETAKDFLDVLFLAVDAKKTSADMESLKLKIAKNILKHAADVQSAYYNLQGSMQMTAMLRNEEGIAKASLEYARRELGTGSSKEFDVLGKEILFEQARLDLLASEEKDLEYTERLMILLGLWGEDINVKIREELPKISKEEISLEHLETVALAKRTDISASREKTERIAKSLSIPIKWRWAIPECFWEKDPSNAKLDVLSDNEFKSISEEPSILPKQKTRLSSNRKKTEMLAIEIRSEIRIAMNRFIAAKNLVERYEKILIPLQEKAVALSQNYHSQMLIGVYHLLKAKQDKTVAYKKHIESIKEYWIARNNLERTIGAKLAHLSENHLSEMLLIFPPSFKG